MRYQVRGGVRYWEHRVSIKLTSQDSCCNWEIQARGQTPRSRSRGAWPSLVKQGILSLITCFLVSLASLLSQNATGIYFSVSFSTVAALISRHKFPHYLPLLSSPPSQLCCQRFLKRMRTFCHPFSCSLLSFSPRMSWHLLLLLSWHYFLRDQHVTPSHKIWSWLLIFHSIHCWGCPFLQVSLLLAPGYSTNRVGVMFSATWYVSGNWMVQNWNVSVSLRKR